MLLIALKDSLVNFFDKTLGELFFKYPYGFSSNDKINQLSLALKYRELRDRKEELPGIMNVGFRNFSQTDEDGILLYIFALIGTTDKIAVEICAEDGIECNSANLIINHGWTGLLFDGNMTSIEKGRYFYAKCKDTVLFPPRFVHAWIDADNINDLIVGNGISGEIDLLTIDMDGNDYWIWNAINCISPRVVVVEFREMWGPEKSVTVPYVSDFKKSNGNPEFYGASLRAFTNLAEKKGYRFVGTNRYGFNAFFIRKEISGDIIPDLSLEKCFSHPRSVELQNNVLPLVKNLNWIEV